MNTIEYPDHTQHYFPGFVLFDALFHRRRYETLLEEVLYGKNKRNIIVPGSCDSGLSSLIDGLSACGSFVICSSEGHSPIISSMLLTGSGSLLFNFENRRLLALLIRTLRLCTKPRYLLLTDEQDVPEKFISLYTELGFEILFISLNSCSVPNSQILSRKGSLIALSGNEAAKYVIAARGTRHLVLLSKQPYADTVTALLEENEK